MLLREELSECNRKFESNEYGSSVCTKKDPPFLSCLHRPPAVSQGALENKTTSRHRYPTKWRPETPFTCVMIGSSTVSHRSHLPFQPSRSNDALQVSGSMRRPEINVVLHHHVHRACVVLYGPFDAALIV